MNWRRGLLFAGIHLVVAGFLSWWQFAAREARENASGSPDVFSGILLAAQEDQTVSFNPCEIWGGHFPPQDHLLMGLEFPAVLVTGQMNFCPSRWTLGALLQAPGKPYTKKTRATLAILLPAVAAFVWFLVASFPLRHPQHWWAEPDAFITVCGCIGGGPLIVFAIVSLIFPTALLWRVPDAIGIFAELAGSVATFAWLWWFGLLVWKLASGGWRLITRRSVAHPS